MEAEMWKKHKQSLMELQQRVRSRLTVGQDKSLSELIMTLEEAESLGRPPSTKRVKKLANGLLTGQHLQEEESRALLHDLSNR